MPFGQIEAFAVDGANLALERLAGASPTFVWLGGFKSDMAGTKAERLARWAEARGQGFVRFDYFGHGQSDGQFEDGTISRWLGDALAVIDHRTTGALVLVGSSMGGWLALLAARARPDRVAGLLLIAPAADFTERLMWAGMSETDQAAILSNGRIEEPSQYSPEPNIITRALIEDGREHLIMDQPYAFAGPVRILQGGADPDVPTAHVEALARLIRCEELIFDLIPDGDHRLSRSSDLERLLAHAEALAR